MFGRRGPSLVRAAATTAVVAGTAGAVRHRQDQKYALAGSGSLRSADGGAAGGGTCRGSGGTGGARRGRRDPEVRSAEGAGPDHRGRVRGQEEADPRDLAGKWSNWEMRTPPGGPRHGNGSPGGAIGVITAQNRGRDAPVGRRGGREQ